MSVESSNQPEPSNQPPQEPAAQEQPGEIIARPGTRYRVTHYILVVVMLLVGAYCAYDGFVAYPREKAKYQAAGKEYPALNIPFNVTLAFALPVLGIALLCMTLHRSRGVYRLVGDTLHIPGHPPIPLDAICRIDKSKWDKKGIAYIEYELPGDSRFGRFRFDDYLYDREPADRIFDIIVKHAQAMAGE